MAVLYGYLSRVAAGRRYKRIALRLMDHAGDAVASVTMGPSLYGGFTGVAWALAHLNGSVFKSDGAEATEAVDDVLKQYVNQPEWRGDYDLVSGLVGFGVYALERLPAPSAIQCLEGIVDRLEETSKRRGDGITWHTPPRLLPPQSRSSIAMWTVWSWPLDRRFLSRDACIWRMDRRHRWTFA